MVGGTVIEVVDLATKVYVNCADKPRGRKRADECAIYVQRTADAEKIELGDALWWQGGFAYWTPCKNRVSGREAENRGLKESVDYDVRIPRIGFSGVSHPMANAGKSIARVRNPVRFWIGWIQRSEDWRPKTFPPSQSILGYWNSGYAADGSPIVFAAVEAEDAGKACYAVFQEWPEAKKEMLENGWRVFQHDKGGDWRPGDRFPLKDWMIERFEKRSVQD